MAYETGTAHDYLDFTDKLRKFVCGYGTHATPASAGVGNGLIGFTSYEYKNYKFGTHPTTITETWTMTCTDVSIEGSELWSVVGSVSGVQVTATTGVAYVNPFIDFELVAGTTGFEVGDTWTVDTIEGRMTTTGQKWTQISDDGYQTGTAENYILLEGHGEAGDDHIYIALRPYADSGQDYHNLLIYGMSGYVDTPREYVNPVSECVPMWNTYLTYWIVADGRRFIISIKISTVYTGGYFGLFLPYATPAQYPYPLCIIGNTAAPSRRWSDAVTSEYGGPFDASLQACKLLRPNNEWLDISNVVAYGNLSYDVLWPRCQGGPATLVHRENLDGSRTLLPYIFITNANGTNTYGELSGVGWVSAFGTMASEDNVLIDGSTYKVFQGVQNTSWNSYWAMKLE